jgi:hypothetical protein
MAVRNEFLRRNAGATHFGNLDLVPSASTLASRLLPSSPLKSGLTNRLLPGKATRIRIWLIHESTNRPSDVDGCVRISRIRKWLQAFYGSRRSAI